MSGESLSVTTLPGDHSFHVSYAPGSNRKIAQLAADVTAETFENPQAYTAERSLEHGLELSKLMTVDCSCNQPDCGIATSYLRGFIEGQRNGSLAAMGNALYDQLIERQRATPLLSSAPAKRISVTRHTNGSSTATITGG